MSQIRSRDSSVSIGWITEHSRFDSRRGQVDPSFLLQGVQTGFRAHPASYFVATRSNATGVKGNYTLPVKLSDFTVWRHIWRKNWVNCAVLTGNSAGLRTVLSSRLSHRELCISLRETHTHIQFSFSCSFFTQFNCMGPLTVSGAMPPLQLYAFMADKDCFTLTCMRKWQKNGGKGFAGCQDKVFWTSFVA